MLKAWLTNRLPAMGCSPDVFFQRMKDLTLENSVTCGTV
jgi:hypothetical protein